MSNPTMTIPTILQIFKLFWNSSNFKINLEKSEILNISASPVQKLNPPLLKTQIPANPDVLIFNNYTPLFTNVGAQVFKNLHLYLLGLKKYILKTYILPKLKFMQTVPIELPK